jgi:hypothetical protein
MITEEEICALKTEVKVIQERLAQLVISGMQYRELTERAVAKAEADMNHRLQGMNEFRGQLERQSTTFITREQIEAARAGYEIAIRQAVEKFETLISSNTERVERMQVSLTKLEARMSTTESADAVGLNTVTRVSAIENQISNWSGKLSIIGIAWTLAILFLSWYLDHH